MVTTAIGHITGVGQARGLVTIADVGCGKLRHLNLLRACASELVLVDTRPQLEAVHADGDLKYTIGDFVVAHQGKRHRLTVLPADRFETTRLKLDVAFSVAVFDVVPRHIRGRILRSIARNLRPDGVFVLIIPRNDSSILRRCRPSNRRWDGYSFPNRDGFTFFRNFRDIRTLIASARRHGFRLEADRSRYRHVCLIFRRRLGPGAQR